MDELITVTDLERKTQIAQDTNKVFRRPQHTGKWHWYNRNEGWNKQSRGFDTFWEALNDAVTPHPFP